jgi:hypothetical protein
MNNKSVFIALVSETIKAHPDWMADLQVAIQGGVASALESERANVATLAYGISLLGFLNGDELTRLLLDGRSGEMPRLLARLFAGSEFGAQIAEIAERKK